MNTNPEYGRSLLKGMTTGTMIDTMIPEIPEQTPIPEGKIIVAQSLLLDFMDYCRKMQLDNVVFVRFPHKNAEQYQVNVEQIQNIVLNNGYAFLNLEEHKDEMGILQFNDYYNTEHLNIYGQSKLTKYLGNLITTDYQVVPRTQSEENMLHWEECVEYYHAFYDYAQEMITRGEEQWPCDAPLNFNAFRSWMLSR